MKRRARTYLSKRFIVIFLTTMIPVLVLPISCLDGDGGGRRTANFEKCEVWPEFRCPNNEVRASWSTSPDTPIKITIEGDTVDKPGHDDYVISASEFNQFQDTVKIELKVNVQGGEKRTFTVKTIRGTQSYLRPGAKVSGTDYKYIVELLPEIWSDDIYVYGLELFRPKSYRCIGSSTDNSFNWQYDKGKAVFGYLNKDNGHRVGFDPKPKAAGEWYFTLRNPGSEQFCDGWKLLNTVPQIWFKVECKSKN